MDKNKHAYDLYAELATNKEAQQFLEVRNAEILTEVMDDKLYRIVLGDETADFKAFLADPRIMYTSSMAYKLVRIHKKMSTIGISSSEWSKVPVNRILDVLGVCTKENYEELFSAAKTLLSRDWNTTVRELKGLPTEEDEHEHENDTYEICKVCGRKHKVHEESNEEGN